MCDVHGANRQFERSLGKSLVNRAEHEKPCEPVSPRGELIATMIYDPKTGDIQYEYARDAKDRR